MKEVWVVGVREDHFCSFDIYLFSTETKARKFFKEEMKEYEDNREFSYDEEHNEATWIYRGDFGSISMWKEEVK